MKFYFDNTTNRSNCEDAQSKGYNFVAVGSNLKRVLGENNIPIGTIDNVDEPGIYYIDLIGEPHQWSGSINNGPHIIDVLPEQVVELAKQKKLRIVLGADREGGLMTGPCGDSTASTAAAIVRKNLPVDSLLVAQGNFKIAEQYIKWYSGTYRPKLFDVMYSNHFAQVVQELQLPNQLAISTAISNIESKDFSSLNRVYRSHRGAHVCALIRDNILDKGLVSFNSEFQEMQFTDHFAAKWCQIPVELYKHIMKPVSPKFIDGDWCSVNAANQYTLSIYQNSLMSFITETKFNEDVAFLTEKIFKPMAVGHPVIMLASAGTLKALRSLGFRTDWCGIDDSYNDIPDDGERFRATHKVLLDWVALPRDEKVTRIKNSLDTLEHNFNLMRERDYYAEALLEAIDNSNRYFNK